MLSTGLSNRASVAFNFLRNLTQNMAEPTSLALSKGSKEPPLNPGVLRVYSMRFCPFVHRTRLILLHKNIPHEVVNINLKSKPDWFLAKTPKGLVPVLEKDKTIVYESLICNEFLDQVYGSTKLIPADPWIRAQQSMLLDRFNVFPGVLYDLMRDEGLKERSLRRIRKALETAESNLSEVYFGGKSPSMLDFNLWPWFERLPAVQLLQQTTLLSPENFPGILRWMNAMKSLPAVKALYFDPNMHAQYFMSAVGGSHNFDLGLSVIAKL